ncbi:MAG: ABC transporter ATP-binding protein [Lentisphaeria bacterium]|nr:ABC transporter ATP-binding protein [Lentisphaeria bacterium]
MSTRKDQTFAPAPGRSVLMKLLPYAKPYRRQFLQLTLIMLAFSGSDAGLPLLSKWAIDSYARAEQHEGLFLFSIVCLGFALVRGIAVRWMITTGALIHTGISHDIRRDGFKHLQTLSFSYFDKHAVGWLMSRLTSDTLELSRMFAWGLVDLVDGLGKTIIIALIMLFLEVKLALVVLSVVPVLFLIVIRSQWVTLKKYREVRQANSEMTGGFNEGVQGAVTTRTLTREARALTEFDTLAGHMETVSINAARRAAVYFPLVLLFSTLGSGLVIWLGGDGVIAGTVSYGTLVAFVAYAGSFFTPLQDLAKRFPQLQNARACAERVFSMLETPPDVVDTPTAVELEQSGHLPDFNGNVIFEDVSFHYTPKEPVLTRFSLTIPAGGSVALVGETGAGKTTISSLLCRFYEPVGGRILIDGVDYLDMPVTWLRRHIGIVLQTPHLFSGSVRDNIVYGDLAATDDAVEAAARVVGAHEFIMDCEGGYAFNVGENGARLSVGQRQLISLARVVLAQPKLLILDEATSAIDTETERVVQTAIDRVLKGRTSLVIAHRLSTIRQADEIVLLRQGHILEKGSHRDLIARRGAYYNLYTSQFVEQAETRLLGESS